MPAFAIPMQGRTTAWVSPGDRMTPDDGTTVWLVSPDNEEQLLYLWSALYAAALAVDQLIRARNVPATAPRMGGRHSIRTMLPPLEPPAGLDVSREPTDEELQQIEEGLA